MCQPTNKKVLTQLTILGALVRLLDNQLAHVLWRHARIPYFLQMHFSRTPVTHAQPRLHHTAPLHSEVMPMTWQSECSQTIITEHSLFQFAELASAHALDTAQELSHYLVNSSSCAPAAVLSSSNRIAGDCELQLWAFCQLRWHRIQLLAAACRLSLGKLRSSAHHRSVAH